MGLPDLLAFAAAKLALRFATGFSEEKELAEQRKAADDVLRPFIEQYPDEWAYLLRLYVDEAVVHKWCLERLGRGPIELLIHDTPVYGRNPLAEEKRERVKQYVKAQEQKCERLGLVRSSASRHWLKANAEAEVIAQRNFKRWTPAHDYGLNHL